MTVIVKCSQSFHYSYSYDCKYDYMGHCNSNCEDKYKLKYE